MACPIFLAALYSSLFASVLSAVAPHVATFGPKAVKGPVPAIPLVAEPDRFDGPKILATNSSVYEWWYFDVLSSDFKSSLQVIFFNALPSAFPLIEGDPSAVSATAFVSFPNGTTNDFLMPAAESKIAWGGSLGNAASGNYIGANASFAGTADLSTYTVSFDWMETYGLKAELKFSSIAPPHYGCSANLAPGQNAQVLPGLGWTNAIPLANMQGSMTFAEGNGSLSTHTFGKGSTGYHDMNWGVKPFYDSAYSWWWGRTSIGPYAVVFWHGLDATKKLHALAYVADTATGKILTSNCVPTQTTISPAYSDQKQQNLKTLGVTIDIPGSNGKKAETLKVSIDVEVPVELSPIYNRWIGKTSGGLVGGKQYQNGMAIFEQFPALSASS